MPPEGCQAGTSAGVAGEEVIVAGDHRAADSTPVAAATAVGATVDGVAAAAAASNSSSKAVGVAAAGTLAAEEGTRGAVKAGEGNPGEEVGVGAEEVAAIAAPSPTVGRAGAGNPGAEGGVDAAARPNGEAADGEEVDAEVAVLRHLGEVLVASCRATRCSASRYLWARAAIPSKRLRGLRSPAKITSYVVVGITK